MASEQSHGGHLDATTDREVVFCHACAHEWYRDEHGLACPECQSDVTEIVELDNDPRFEDGQDADDTAPPSPQLQSFHLRNDDSDPGEADIEEHMGPHGFLHHRDTRSGPQHQHHDPDADPVIQRFIDMVQNFGPPRRVGAFGNDGHGGHGEQEEHGGHGGEGHEEGHGEGHGGDRPRPHVHRTTFTSGGTTASLTIFSGPPPRANQDGSDTGAPVDPFQSIFSSILRDIGPPHAQQQHGQGQGFARGLSEILSLFNPSNAVHGDAVYTQEALDRIISNLMEAHPQSNAAPPATEEGLAKLERRTVDADLLKDCKTECSICIDEVKVGEVAAFLPCKHWFHEQCVVFWLKEHNTCPVCRTPIEEAPAASSAGNSTENAQAGGSNNNSTTQDGRPNNIGGPFFARAPFMTQPFAQGWTSEYGQPPQPTPPGPSVRPPNQSQDRLNQAMRDISALQEERQRNRTRGTSSGFSYDTSRLQRRTSHSPTSPRVPEGGDETSRMRERSPSQSSRRADREDDSQDHGAGGGPLSWLRGRFSGAGNDRQYR